MRKAAIAVVVASVFGMTACQQQDTDLTKVEEIKFENEQQKFAYAYGASVGSFVESKIAEQQELSVELDKELMIKGFIAGMQGESQFDTNELQVLNNDLDKVLAEAKEKKAEANIAKGKEWLAENAKKENVMVTDSGLQYEVMVSSEGDKPEATDTVKVHYRGTLLDGTEFDSSYSRGEPAVFPLNRVIAGWTEGVQLMNTGSKYKFYIPSELAYGNRATGKITPNSTLIFEVELLEIVNKASSN